MGCEVGRFIGCLLGCVLGCCVGWRDGCAVGCRVGCRGEGSKSKGVKGSEVKHREEGQGSGIVC